MLLLTLTPVLLLTDCLVLLLDDCETFVVLLEDLDDEELLIETTVLLELLLTDCWVLLELVLE